MKQQMKLLMALFALSLLPASEVLAQAKPVKPPTRSDQPVKSKPPTKTAAANRLYGCPDSNHPHKIDLGLPSGTKWACCNVGASAPERNGNYYRWGEIKPTKNGDNWMTYQFAHDRNGNGILDEDEYDNLGDNIAGTKYDAATANWRTPWRMPTEDQMEELMNNCTYKWTTQNGMKGGKVTGPNGNVIFLPASGNRHYRRGTLDMVGSAGYYRSASLCNGGCRELFFGSGGLWCNYCGRYEGFPVRAVAE